VNINSISTDDGKYFIVINGLNPGDLIVTEGIISLKDGDTIIPKEVEAVSYYKNINQ
jgi:membrane fusion protein (multidrug efflux system)